MDFQSWIQNIGGLAGVYSFDILSDGSYSEIRLMAVNQQNTGILHMTPDAPEFYPGIPYRKYWMDINFEDMVYKCGSSGEPQYSYVNAQQFWLKCHFIPVSEPDTVSAEVFEQNSKTIEKTVYCLYIVTFSPQVETDSMAQKPPEVANAAINIGLKLHESEDFYQAMTAAVSEIEKNCGVARCAIYTVNKSTRECCMINDEGLQNESMQSISKGMGRTPFEVAEAWEKDLELSDCLMLEELNVIAERDPIWYESLMEYDINNIILYAVRNNQDLVGFIWAINFDISRKEIIKEIFEVSSFVIAAAIVNHQLVSQLELKSSIDGLTHLLNRNSMNERVDELVSGKINKPREMGVVLADLNGLKNVNDDEGHDAGDKLLIRAAALLKLAFGDYEIYRAGGDEFFVFCPDISEEKLDQQVKQLRALADSTPDVSFAVGCVYVTGEYDIRNAMKNADERMYKDKQEYYRLHPEKDRRRQKRSESDSD